jgi:hypothetical protein
MAEAEFSPEGVTLRLAKEEWWFVSSAIAYVLHGKRLPDHDFRNILMVEPPDAERLSNELQGAERRARISGNHWSPRPDW